MKKLAIATLGLAVLSTSAFASKARLEALGQDANGSQWLDDNRNVFLNPAHLNTHYDWMTLEFGDTDSASATGQDEAANPKAEGGMFRNAGNMIYGINFGNESNTSNALRTSAMAADVVHESNNLDLFVAGDAGVQWGVRLTHHQFEDSTAGNDISSTAQRLTAGVVSGNIDAYLNFGLGNKAENGTAEFNGTSSMDLGVTYNAGDVDYLLRYVSIAAEDASENEYSTTRTWVGAAKTYKLNDKATAFAEAWYRMESTEDDISGSGETKSTYLPVVLGMEVAAKDWLMFRGSITHEVIGTDEDNAGDTETRADTTVVAAGASLVYGDFQIDGLISNDSNGDGTVGANTEAGLGTLRTDALMSRVSMTYKF